MEYTIQKLSQLAGISTRTLRYYDEIALLAPLKVNSSGYRIYGKEQLDQLQHILFYRELGVSLEQIKCLLKVPSFDVEKTLASHREALLAKRKQLDLLITTVDKTIATMKGEIIMKDKEKFEGFKQTCLEENERQYGKEIRGKYGEDVIAQSNSHFKNMSQEQYLKMEALGAEIGTTLKEAVATANPASELAQKCCELHKQWITLCWGHYSKDAHMGLAQLYVDDERFSKYYNTIVEGGAIFLRDAMRIFIQS